MTGIPPIENYITATLDGSTTTVTGGWIPLQADGCTVVTMHGEWNADTSTSQDLAATAAFEISNDPGVHRELVGLDAADTADSQDITASVTGATDINPTTGAGDGDLTIANLTYGWFRIKFTRASGDGDVKVNFSASPS